MCGYMFKAIFRFLISVILIAIVFTSTAQKAMAFDFSLSLNPERGSVDKGGTLKAAVNIYWSSSDKGYVSLFPAIEPEGVDIRFSPSSCRPPCSSIMTIYIRKEAQNKSYAIPIIATGEGVSRTVNYQLSISPLPLTLKTPALISPNNNSIVSGSTSLNWPKVDGAEIYQWTFGSKNGQTAINSLFISAGMLNYNTKYDWKIRACNLSQDNCSGWSEIWSFTTSKNQVSVPDNKALLASLQEQILIIKNALLLLQEQLRKLLGN